MDLQELKLKILGDSTGAEAALGRVNASTVNLGSIVKSIIAGAAVAAMVKWTETTINLGIEAEKAGALLDATMKHTLNSTNEQVAACKSWAENQEKVNHFDAEELMAQLDKGIVKYGDLGTAQVAVSAAQEVARLKGIDVASAYSLVEQASNGMARSLKQFGIEAKGGTTQLQYLQQILDKTSGSTEAYNKTTAGMIGAMKQSYEVMRETLGQALLPIVNTLMTQLSPIIENLTNYIIDNMPQIQSIVAKVCDAIGWTFEVVGKGIANFVANLKDLIGWAKEAINWVGDVLANKGVNQGGVYATVPTGGRGTINREAGAASPSSDVAKGIVAVTHAYNGLSVAAVDSGIAATKASTAGADAAKKLADAAKAAADAIKTARQGITDKIYTLTHTDQQNEQRALDQEYAANVQSSKDKIASRTLYVAESKALVQKYADAVKAVYQTVTDKIYTLTHTDVQNQQRALDQELAANLKSGVDKMTAETLYHDECAVLEKEQTAKLKTELDARIAAQQKYQEAVASATQSLLDQISMATQSQAQQDAISIAKQAATAIASGVSPTIVSQYTATMTKDMYKDTMAQLTAAATLAPGQTSFTSAQTAEIARLQALVAQLQAAQQQYLSAPAIVTAIKDMGTTIVAAVTSVAGGVGRAINGMAIP